MNRWLGLSALAFAALSPICGGATLQELLTRQGYTTVPLQRTRYNSLSLSAKVNNRTMVVMIDTGAPALCIDTGKTRGMPRVAKAPRTFEGLFASFTTPGEIVS